MVTTTEEDGLHCGAPQAYEASASAGTVSPMVQVQPTGAWATSVTASAPATTPVTVVTMGANPVRVHSAVKLNVAPTGRPATSPDTVLATVIAAVCRTSSLSTVIWSVAGSNPNCGASHWYDGSAEGSVNAFSVATQVDPTSTAPAGPVRVAAPSPVMLQVPPTTTLSGA